MKTTVIQANINSDDIVEKALELYVNLTKAFESEDREELPCTATYAAGLVAGLIALHLPAKDAIQIAEMVKAVIDEAEAEDCDCSRCRKNK